MKINAVLLRGVNDDQAADLLAGHDAGLQLRFIEQMPLDAQHGWSRTEMITADEILEQLEREFDARRPSRRDAAAVHRPSCSRRRRHRHTVGIIAAVTRPFCGDCDRVRLTADGQLRNCLFARSESDLRAALRRGADRRRDRGPLAARRRGKRAGHGIDDPSFLQPTRPMSAIGG